MFLIPLNSLSSNSLFKRACRVSAYKSLQGGRSKEMRTVKAGEKNQLPKVFNIEKVVIMG
jgi:hypothetical protein